MTHRGIPVRSESSRREFLASLGAVVMAPASLALAQRSSISGRFLSNAIIGVSNLQRSTEFYQHLLGPAIVHDGLAIFRFAEGGRFLGLTQVRSGAKPGYVSYGIAVDNFDPEATKKALAAAGVTGADVSMRGDTPELWFSDAEGIRVQMQHPSYLRGTGSLGAVLPAAGTQAKEPVFAARTFSHVTVSVKNGPASMKFYQGVLGLKVQAMQGPVAAMLAIGAGPDFVAVPTGVNPGGRGDIDHACLTVANFDPQKLMARLIDLGLEPVEITPSRPMTCGIRFRQRASNGGGRSSPMGTPELYLQDADNIRLQVADIRYCGGSGWYGETCP